MKGQQLLYKYHKTTTKRLKKRTQTIIGIVNGLFSLSFFLQCCPNLCDTKTFETGFGVHSLLTILLNGHIHILEKGTCVRVAITDLNRHTQDIRFFLSCHCIEIVELCIFCLDLEKIKRIWVEKLSYGSDYEH